MTTQPLPDPGPERRIAWLPILAAAFGVVLAIVLTTVIVSLATAPSPDAAAPVLPSTTPSPTAAAPAEAAPAPAPRPDPEANECVDALGDGGTFDLDSAAVSDDDGELVARFTLAETAVGDGATSLGVTATRDDGRASYLLAVRWIDGDLQEAVIADLSGDSGNSGRGNGNDDSTGIDSIDLERVDVTGYVVTVRFPERVLDDLGRSWSWSAASSAETTTDVCGDGALSWER